MRRSLDKAEDLAQYVIAAPVFAVVAAFTAILMAIGFPVIETYERLRHRG